MVVGAPDIDHRFKAAAEFVVMIGNVRGKIGRDPVVANNHPVLVVAKIGAAQPERTILVIGVAFFP